MVAWDTVLLPKEHVPDIIYTSNSQVVYVDYITHSAVYAGVAQTQINVPDIVHNPYA